MNLARLWLVSCLLPLVACETKHTATAAGPAAAPVEVAAPTPPLPPPDSSRGPNTFTWQDETCANTGTFPAGAYSLQQLQDTYQLVTGFLLIADVSPFQLEDYTDARFAQAAARLQHDHDSLATALRGLNVVPIPFWRRIKHLRELELAECYAWQQAAIAGYFHPETLLHNTYAAACPTYTAALVSTDTAVVLRAWHQLINEEKAHNGAPENLEDEFQEQSASPQRMAYGKMKLLAFGWWNCANAQRKYNDLYDQYHLYPRFTKLFTHVKQTGCTDAD